MADIATPAAAPATPTTTPDASASPTTPAATTAPAIPKTVTIGGKTFSEADVMTAIGKADTVAQGLKQLASERKALDEAQGQFKDPKKLRAFLKQNGYDPEKFAEETIVEAMEQEAMDPRDKELADFRAEKADREAAAKAAVEKKSKDEHQKRVEETIRAFEGQLEDALVAHKLPRTAQTVMQVTEIMQDGVEAGLDISPAEAAQLVRKQLLAGSKDFYKGMPVENLKEFLGPEIVETLIKDHQASLQASQTRAPDAKAEKTTSGKTGAARKEREPAKRWSDIFG